MEQADFADGFDTPDRIAFGLGAGQILVVATGALTAYALWKAPLPGPVGTAMALIVAGIAAALGWLRVAGRPALDTAVFAAQWWRRPRRGTLSISRALAPGEAGPPPPEQPHPTTPAPGTATIVPLFAGVPAAARRLTFCSLRGGTGRSTLATELACLLSEPAAPPGRRLRVALVDLDIRSASVSVRLGIPERTVIDYALAPPDERRVTDFLSIHGSGARVLLGPPRAPEGAGTMTPAVLREVFRELDMEGFDAVVVDLPPDMSPLTTAALSACDDVFVVMTPTACGIHDVYSTTEALRRLGLRRRLRYVVNRARAGTDVSIPMKDLGGEVVAEIPEDERVVGAENHHRQVGLDAASPAGVALRALANRVGAELVTSR